MGAKRYLHYPAEFFFAVFNRFTSTGAVALFWVVVSQNSSLALDTRYLISYYLIVGGLAQISSAHLVVAGSISKSIKFGSMSSFLIRPFDAFYARYAAHIGFAAPLMLVSLVMIVCGVVIYGGELNLVSVAVSIFNLLLINQAFNYFAASTTFYVIESQGVRNTIMHILAISQGFFIPISLMPQTVKSILEYTPFPHSMYLPATALLGEAIPPKTLLIGAFWAILLIILGRKFWAYSLKRFEAVGI